MRLMDLFGRQRTAKTAQHRLQVLLMHERGGPGKADLIPILREDIVAAIGKHIPVDPDKVQVRVERGEAVSLLEIDIEISTSRNTCCRGARPRSSSAKPACADVGFSDKSEKKREKDKSTATTARTGIALL